MLGPQRHRHILDRLSRSGSVRVTELAQELQVTEETVRRDLEKLDVDGKLIRIHGGALRIDDDRDELPFGVRETVNLEAKRSIARQAVKHVAEGDVIALDASSTATELARLIPDIPLTVVTNGLAVTSALLDRQRVRLVCTGGILDTPSLSYLGTLAESAFERFNVRKLFFSCKGVDLARGLSVTADGQARMKRRMLDLAEASYLLVDSSKLGTRAVEFFASLEEVDLLITNGPADAAILKEIAARGVAIETA
ncbi:MAG: DeoR/GlpR family DNA-binding transcription regulator [Planctomycetota bacterium]